MIHPKKPFVPEQRETLPLSEAGCGTSGIERCDPVPLPGGLAGHPRYEVVQFLGAGGMGVVYKAWHRLMHRYVALKVLNEGLIGIPGMLERFQREVRAAARLSHPNIVHAYDADHWGDTHFLVMEYVDGIDLDRLVNREGRLSIEQACNYTRQAARALQHAFERGMIHRDIKPHNLMLAVGGQIKVLDFGLARVVDQLIGSPEPGMPAGRSTAAFETGAEGRLGTADYMAPEVLDDPQQATIRSDIYSLGCTLYHLLTGRAPCRSEEIEEKIDCHRKHQMRPVEKLRPETPVELVRIVDRMLAVDPAERFATPDEAAAALSAVDTSRPSQQVLIVDDEPAMRFAMSRMLGQEGYAVTCVSNGGEALSRLRAGLQPDVILLDMMMPVMNGWQFLRERQRDDRLASIPVVVVSATDAVAERAAAAGAVDCLHKPVHREELAAALESIHVSR
jgi:serine/threonine protein kinase